MSRQQKNFFASEKTTSEFFYDFQLLFGAYGYKENSLWEKCDALIIDAKEIKNGEALHDRAEEFFWSVTALIDSDSLFQLRGAIARLVNLFNNPPTGRQRNENQNSVDFDEACERLEITEFSKNFFRERVELLGDEEKNKVKQDLGSLVSIYEKARPDIMLVASALLHRTEDGLPTTVAEFREKITFSGLVDYGRITNYAPLLRYLGQSFFGNDMDTAIMAYGVLSELSRDNNLVKKGIIDKFENKLLFTVLLFIVFDQFSNFTVVEMDGLMANFGWFALDAGFPLVELLEEYLANQPNLREYINQSGMFAEDLLNSAQMVFPHEGEIDVVVGSFLAVYLEFADGKELDANKQNEFLDIEMRIHEWPADKREKLLNLIDLYLHLRECDLIDYYGLLSDEGIIKKPYDWAVVLEGEIGDKKVQEIKKYFSLVHRPFRMKMELLSAFRSIIWQNEPFLSRVLVLNDAFEEIYGQTHSPLIFFDETSLAWKLNDIPSVDLVNKFYSRISRDQEKNIKKEIQ